VALSRACLQAAQEANACMLFLPECFSFIGTSQQEVSAVLTTAPVFLIKRIEK